MAKESVDAIREAELKATQIEKEAMNEKSAILLKAEEEAEKIISSMTEKAHMQSQEQLKKAQEQGESYMEAAVLRAERQISLMKDAVREKEQEVINLILSEVIA